MFLYYQAQYLPRARYTLHVINMIFDNLQEKHYEYYSDIKFSLERSVGAHGAKNILSKNESQVT